MKKYIIGGIIGVLFNYSLGATYLLYKVVTKKWIIVYI